MSKKVVFIYNEVEAHLRTGVFADCASKELVTTVHQALLQSGNEVFCINLTNENEARKFLTTNGPFEMAFVIAEGFLDNPESFYDGSGAASVRKLLRELNIPYTHSPVETMESCRHKEKTYEVLGAGGIPIPKNWYINPENSISLQVEAIAKEAEFPLFVKPNGGGNSIGIDENSVVNNKEELLNKVEALINQLGEVPIIVETFLPGREYTVGVIGNEKPYVLPIVAFPEHYTVRSTDCKRNEHNERELFEIILAEDPRYQEIAVIATKTFHTLKANDIIRIDLREDINGRLKVIDVNGTPSLGKSGSLCYSLESIDITHGDLINLLLSQAINRVYNFGSITLEEELQEVRRLLERYFAVEEEIIHVS